MQIVFKRTEQVLGRYIFTKRLFKDSFKAPLCLAAWRYISLIAWQCKRKNIRVIRRNVLFLSSYSAFRYLTFTVHCGKLEVWKAHSVSTPSGWSTWMENPLCINTEIPEMPLLKELIHPEFYIVCLTHLSKRFAGWRKTEQFWLPGFSKQLSKL